MEAGVKFEGIEGEGICAVIGIPIYQNQGVDDCCTWIHARYKTNTVI